MSKSKHQVPNHLLKPLLLRSRESMVDNGPHCGESLPKLQDGT